MSAALLRMREWIKQKKSFLFGPKPTLSFNTDSHKEQLHRFSWAARGGNGRSRGPIAPSKQHFPPQGQQERAWRKWAPGYDLQRVLCPSTPQVSALETQVCYKMQNVYSGAAKGVDAASVQIQSGALQMTHWHFLVKLSQASLLQTAVRIQKSLCIGCLPFYWCRESVVGGNNTLKRLCDGEALLRCSLQSLCTGNPSLMQPLVPESPLRQELLWLARNPPSWRLQELLTMAQWCCWPSTKLRTCLCVAAWPSEDLVLSAPFPFSWLFREGPSDQGGGCSLGKIFHPASTSYWLGFWVACNSKQLWLPCTNGDLWKDITGRSCSICHGHNDWPLTINPFLFSIFQDWRSGERTCALIILGWDWLSFCSERWSPRIIFHQDHHQWRGAEDDSAVGKWWAIREGTMVGSQSWWMSTR